MVRLLGCLLAALTLASCQAREHERKDYAEMNAIALKSVCVGRLEIDLPAKGSLEWRASFDQAEVTRVRPPAQSADTFWSRVESRKVELESLSHRTEGNRLGLHEKIGDNAAIILYRDRGHRKGSYMMERYLWLGDRGYLFESGPWSNDVRDKVDRNSHVFSLLTPHDRNGQPQASGFCIEGATVTGDFGQISAGGIVELSNWEAARLNFGTFENYPPTELDRTAFEEVERDQAFYRAIKGDSDFRAEPDSPKDFEVLRRRELSVGGFAGQEAAWRKTLNNGAVLYQVIWRTDELIGQKTSPGIALGLRTGDESGSGNATPSEEELLALWDAVLDSVRLR